jgi:protein-S-isoprenylcysteine O-methyltransferase Ste14
MDWGRVAKRIRVPLGFLFAAFFLWRARPEWWSLAIGSVIALAGVWIRAISSGHVKKNEELATTGPYAYIRNPLYLGSIVIAGGFALAALRWEIALALVLMFAAIYIPVIRGEERFLNEHFANYAEYCARVPRLLPSFPPSFPPGRSRFSRELYLKHREYNALLGTLAVIVALVALKVARPIWMAH